MHVFRPHVAAACTLLLLAACGGGGGGSPSDDQSDTSGNAAVDEQPGTANPGDGSMMQGDADTLRPLATDWDDNPTAEDLLDHWNDPERARAELSLEEVSDMPARRAVISSLLVSADGNTAGTGTALRNVRAEDIQIIGKRDGITYGQWKGGPAGTLNIDFDWRFAPDIDSATRARVERAGKSWSWRLMDKDRTHVAPSGTPFIWDPEVWGERLLARFEDTLDEDVRTNGVLIFVQDQGAHSGSASWALWSWPDAFLNYPNHSPELIPDDFDPWLATMLLSRRDHDDTWVLAHEIGHVLGDYWHLRQEDFPDVYSLVNRTDGTFEGPRAIRANGGKPVPFQWWDAEYRAVTPGTPGATIDWSHPGVCDSIMAYCSYSTTEAPSELDFAILADLGYKILDKETASEPELYGYGAWGRYGAWGVGVERVWSGSDDMLRAGADAFGMSPTTNLADSTALTGDATWTGSLLGVDVGQDALPPVFGDAELSVDLEDLTGTALFDDLSVDVDGVSSPFRMTSLSYDVSISGNTFADDEGRLTGGFFGRAHEEMAGVLEDRDAELLAGFGGTR